MIKERVREILSHIPDSVLVVAATKGRSVPEIEEAIEAGIKVIGENYVQEAEGKFCILQKRVEWHFIGHLQKNKVKRAVKIFDMIQTVDSLELTLKIDKECKTIGKVMPILIEVNVGNEPQKVGVQLYEVEELVKNINQVNLNNILLSGLMCMGPLVDNPEDIRPYFREVKRIFTEIKLKYPNLNSWQYLSMGMSDTYNIAIEEGANIVRLGRKLFG